MKKIAFSFVVLLVLAGGMVAFAFLSVPNVSLLIKENPPTTALIEQRAEEARRAGRSERRVQVWIPLNAIAPVLKSTVLIGEDDAFFQHQGVDFEQIKQSFVRDWEQKSLVRGGSTITQQLAKNLYLSTSKNPFRKLREFFIARRMESELGKRRILEIYLNVIEWGPGVYGVQAASLTYFHKPASALNAKEAAMLAAMIPNPRGMSPLHPTKRFARRTNMILARLHQYHHISDGQFEQAVEKEPEGAEEPENLAPTDSGVELPSDAQPLPVDQWPAEKK
jgi:monofunctional biosynthetic peptidoglycan transglycosylase